MFSEYASRLLHQSQVRTGVVRCQPAPLFDGRYDDREDIRESLALRQSRGRFGAFLPVESDEEEDVAEYEPDDHAMRSSWRPPLPERRDSENSAAPEDIMFGVPLDKSRVVLHNSGGIQPAIDHSSESIGGLTAHPDRPLPSTIEPVVDKRHDATFGAFYFLSLAMIGSTSMLLWLTTSVPSSLPSDSVYSALHYGMLPVARHSATALLIATAWFWLLCRHVRPVTYVSVTVPPLVVGAFGTYATVNRLYLLGLAMYAATGIWLIGAYRRRASLGRAVSVISLACTVLRRYPQIIAMAASLTALFLTFTAIWLYHFERIFLRSTSTGYHGGWRSIAESYGMGVFFCSVYLWTYGVTQGLLRAAISAIASHWFFHRHEHQTPTEQQVSRAAIRHALCTNFGSICLSSLLAISARIPLLILPRKLSAALSLAGQVFLSAPLLNLGNPLTLSLAAIHAIKLSDAAAESQRLHLLDHSGPWQSYRTAKMYLMAARATTAIALGTVAWVSSDSIYGHVIGIASATIGWTMVGAVESCASTVVDAVFVCFVIDLRDTREGQTHCQDAAQAFGQGIRDGALA
ncbi:hypothetical protein PYCC9005_003050 [Savitreella phatthalungensis]